MARLEVVLGKSYRNPPRFLRVAHCRQAGVAELLGFGVGQEARRAPVRRPEAARKFKGDWLNLSAGTLRL